MPQEPKSEIFCHFGIHGYFFFPTMDKLSFVIAPLLLLFIHFIFKSSTYVIVHRCNYYTIDMIYVHPYLQCYAAEFLVALLLHYMYL